MGLADEAVAAATPLGSTLQAGLDSISYNQQITFTLYNRVVLPLDGYVFWVQSSPLKTFTVGGSLHYSSDTIQEETQTSTVNTVLFTSKEPIDALNKIGPNQVYIGEFDGLRFAFSQRGMLYRQAMLWHYRGAAIYPDVAPQVVTDGDTLDPTKVIVSNSLPLWLALNGYVPPNPGLGFPNPVTLYPSHLVPQNIAPPWASVDVTTDLNAGIMSTPLLLSDGSHYQLVTDRVRITLYGMDNDKALTFIDCVNQYSLTADTFGIMNIPVLRDEKRTQAELAVIAQKKSVEFEISYYQLTARNIAQQLIKEVNATFIVAGATR